MRKGMESKYKETTFFGMFRISGPKLVFNFTLLNSLLLIGFIHYIFSGFELTDFNVYTPEIAKDLYNRISGMSASIFGIVIAALAVSMTIFNQKVLEPLEKTRLLHKFLFPFWYLVVLWGCVIIISTVAPYLYELGNIQPIYLTYLFLFELWLFIYAMFFAIKLTGLLIRLFLQNARVL
ncbi:hypothetical protein [Solibacillus sp. FSL K6-1523]|uniref:hypothetical protein n=1 Tax=Solibacillus sp. FSL K6-1523 TaxID=2921471 RepID=UPI0030F94E08